MRRSDRIILDAVFLLVLLVFTAAFARLMQPFWLTLFLAVILVNVFRRPYRALVSRGLPPPVAAATTLLLVALIVIVPVTLIAALVAAEVAALVLNVQSNWSAIQTALSLNAIEETLRSVPVIGAVVESLPDFDLSATARNLAGGIGDTLLRVSQQSFAGVTAFLFDFAMMLVIAFFLFTDGHRVTRRVYQTIPISNDELDQISGETLTTTSATLTSTILIGVLEGGMTTVTFLLTGIPSPFLWGVITVVVSMIPLVGTSLILIPAAIISMVGGRIVAGVVILAVAAIGVSFSQYVVKPRLVGDRSGLHPALALLSTIGGLAWLGLVGFLVGPVLAALFVVVWRQFTRRYRTLLADKDGTPATEGVAEPPTD